MHKDNNAFEHFFKNLSKKTQLKNLISKKEQQNAGLQKGMGGKDFLLL